MQMGFLGNGSHMIGRKSKMVGHGAMWKKLFGLEIVVILVLAGSAFADYIVDRKAAMKLYEERKYEQACAAFERMAAGEISDVQKSDALHQAAYCAYRLKQYDKATEFAKQIPLDAESKSTQLALMNWTRKWKDAIAKFKNEDIASWPDHVKYEAYYARGSSAYRTNNPELAISDLSEAVKYARGKNNRALTLNTLADVYKDLLNDNEKALEVYQRVLAEKHIYKGTVACISMSNIYLSQGKQQEALSALELVDIGKLSGSYKAMILVQRAKVLAAMDKKVKAIATYKEALAVVKIPGYVKKKCESALEKLEN